MGMPPISTVGHVAAPVPSMVMRTPMAVCATWSCGATAWAVIRASGLRRATPTMNMSLFL
jgi:hypothetical protein